MSIINQLGCAILNIFEALVIIAHITNVIWQINMNSLI